MTAIEWLIDQIDNKGKWRNEVLNQAKEIEKQQIIDAYVSGEHQQGFEVEAEQYYNETFKKTNK